MCTPTSFGFVTLRAPCSRSLLAMTDALLGDRLVRLAQTRMPFGKYQGRWLTDLPVAYLLWFEHHDNMPGGELGELMILTLELKRNGGIGLVTELRHRLNNSR